MKKIILIFILLGSAAIMATPYIEYKNEVVLVSNNHIKDIDHYRIGYQHILPKGFIFIETGKMTNGKSGEIGYKFNKDNWTFKGKWEYKNQDYFPNQSKLQTEIRYNFIR